MVDKIKNHNIKPNMENQIEEKIEQSLAVVRNETATISELKDLKISGQPTLEKSAEGLKAISRVSKIIKEEKDKNIKPLRQVIANINDFWKPFETVIDEAEKHIKSEQKKYKDKMDAAAAEEKRELAEKFDKGEATMEEIEKSGEKLKKFEDKTSLIKTYTYTGVRILDKKMIPLEFMDPNTAAIQTAIEAGMPVPGAELYKEERVKK